MTSPRTRGRVLIVGSGFVARAAARGLCEEPACEVLLTSTRPGSPFIQGLPLAAFNADLSSNDPAALERIRSFDPDVTLLAFGRGMDRSHTEREVVLANAVYPREVVEWLGRETRCRTFIQVGTCFEYGASPDEERLSESWEPRPFNVYGASKLAACLSLREYALSGGRQVIHVRPFTLFGPGENDHRLTPTVFEACRRGAPARFSDGLQRRDFVYAADAGRFFASLLRARGRLGSWQVLNLCTGEGVAVRGFVTTVVGVLRDRFGCAPAELRFDLPRKWPNEPDAVVGDPSLARKLLGWSPAWSLPEAIADYWVTETARRGSSGSNGKGEPDER